jgi:hypothetical protein
MERDRGRQLRVGGQSEQARPDSRFHAGQVEDQSSAGDRYGIAMVAQYAFFVNSDACSENPLGGG